MADILIPDVPEDVIAAIDMNSLNATDLQRRKSEAMNRLSTHVPLTFGTVPKLGD